MKWLPNNAAIFSMILASTAAISAQPAHDLLLADTMVNMMPQGVSIMLWDGGSGFYVGKDDLVKWRVRPPFPTPINFEGDDFFPLDGLPGARATYDEKNVRVLIVLPPSVLQPLFSSVSDSRLPEPATGNGVFLDYDWSYIDTGESYVAGIVGPTVFTSAGVFFSDFAYRDADASVHDTGGRDLVRLESNLTRDDPQRMRSYRVGDIFSAPGPWGGAYRIGGLQVASNFSTQPSFITFPVPSLTGSAALPSAVDLYVDGVLRHRENIDPGEFELNEIPVVTGEGEIRMVVTDVLGREQVVTQSFYASSQLLRTGLSEYSYSAGLLRHNFGLESNDYGEFALVADHRYGLSDRLTAGGRMELSPGRWALAGNADFSPHRGGVINSGLGFSAGDQGFGSAFLLGYEYESDAFRFDVRATATSADFSVIDPLLEAKPPAFQFVASGGWSAGIPGSVGISFVHQTFRDKQARDVLSLSHNRVLGRGFAVSGYMSYIDAGQADWIAGVSLTRSFGNRRSINSQFNVASQESRARVETLYSPPVGSGVGYRLGSTVSNNNNYIDASVIGQTKYGRYLADWQAGADVTSWRFNTTGALVWLAGRPYAAREINEGFAVVRVGKFENVRVYLENQEVGRSDSSGRLLLPALRPYEINRVRIEARDLPLGARVDEISLDVSPYYRSGTVIEFPVSFSRSVILHAVRKSGKPIPEGAVVRIADDDERFVTGLAGLIYVRGISQETTLHVSWPSGGECELQIELPDDDDPLPDLGERVCKDVTK